VQSRQAVKQTGGVERVNSATVSQTESQQTQTLLQYSHQVTSATTSVSDSRGEMGGGMIDS